MASSPVALEPLRTPFSQESARDSYIKATAMWLFLLPISLDQSSISGKGSLGYLGRRPAESAVWATSVTAEFDPSFDSALGPARPSPVRL